AAARQIAVQFGVPPLLHDAFIRWARNSHDDRDIAALLPALTGDMSLPVTDTPLKKKSTPSKQHWITFLSAGVVISVALFAWLEGRGGESIKGTYAEGGGKGRFGNMTYAPTGVLAVKACAVIEPLAEVCTNAY